MTTKHTPGPWKAYAGTKVRMLRGMELVAETPATPGDELHHDISQAEAEANARLIAAAPELLEACEKAILAFAEMERLGHPVPQTFRMFLRGVIDKAEGR